jgi:hypothetical protein
MHIKNWEWGKILVQCKRVTLTKELPQFGEEKIEAQTAMKRGMSEPRVRQLAPPSPVV